MIFSAMRLMTGTDTELPACLYLWLFAIFGNENLSGNPWNLRHSSGVSLRMPKSSRIIGTLCPPVPMFAVSVGQTLLLFSLTYTLRHW